MNMKIDVCVLAAAFALLAGAQGVPEVSMVTMAQDDASREVTITYKLENAPAVITLDITTNGVSIGGENIQNFSADSALWKRIETDGTYTIKWHPDLSWPDHRITLDQGGVKAVVKAWALDNTPDYMVVDLTAAANTQKYYPGEAFLPGGLLGNASYRTAMIVMRKMMAKNVPWTMGSIGEIGRDADNEAAHTVTLTNNYYIGVFEVTQAQYSFMRTDPKTAFTLDGAMRPVEGVSYKEIRLASWSGASSGWVESYWPEKPNDQSSIGVLRLATGLDFDLPSEAEWEFAARAGHGDGFWGDGSPVRGDSSDENLPGRYRYRDGWKEEGAVEIPKNDFAVTGTDHGTAVVGSYAPNSWGLYDMHGNVNEWCLDWYEDDITSINGAVNIDPKTPANTLASGVGGNSRAARGGCWYQNAYTCRSAYRVGVDQTTRSERYGFRLVCRAGLK